MNNLSRQYRNNLITATENEKIQSLEKYIIDLVTENTKINLLFQKQMYLICQLQNHIQQLKTYLPKSLQSDQRFCQLSK